MAIDLSDLAAALIDSEEPEETGSEGEGSNFVVLDQEQDVSPDQTAVEEFDSFDSAEGALDESNDVDIFEEATDNLRDAVIGNITPADVVFDNVLAGASKATQITNSSIFTAETPIERGRRISNYQNSYSHNGDIADKIRYFGGFYWTQDARNHQRQILSDRDFSQIKVPFFITIEEELNASFLTGIPLRKTKVKIIPNVDAFSDEEGFLIENQWFDFVLGGTFNGFTHDGFYQEGESFEDFAFSIESIADRRKVTDTAANSMKTANLESNYLFLNESLETNVENIEEANIIDFYSTTFQELYPANNSTIRNHVTLYDTINQYSGLDLEYLEDWSSIVGLVNDNKLQKLQDSYKYKIFNNFTPEFLTEVSSEVDFYPYHNYLSLQTFGEGPIVQELIDSSLFREYFNDQIASRNIISNEYNESDTLDVFRTDEVFDGIRTDNEIKREELRMWSVADSFAEVLQTNLEQAEREVIGVDAEGEDEGSYFGFISDDVFEEEEEDSGGANFIGNILDEETMNNLRDAASDYLEDYDILKLLREKFSVIFKDIDTGDDFSNLFGGSDALENIRDIINNSFRSYEQILVGEKAPTEIIGFKVSKYDFELDNNNIEDLGDPVQEIMFPNMVEVFEYYDSQVKFGKNYDYEISAYALVIGNKYNYKSEEESPLSSFTAPDFAFNISVTNSPLVRLIEIPLLDLGNTMILDKPPVIPDVDIKAYKGIDNKILIDLTKGIGTFNEIPISFISDTQEDKIEFRSDGAVTNFEVYRTEFPPESYQDFASNRIANVSTDLLGGNNGFSDHVSYKDSIEPNTEYYYTFRARDFHDNLSNPTNVFKVRMYSDKGANSLEVELYEFPEKGVDSIEFSKFLNIKPTDLQRRVTKENDTEVVAARYEVGAVEDLVWDKEFKFRITSKSTNKKIDINCKFKYTKRGLTFGFTDFNKIVVADTFSEALQFLLIEQEGELL